jgi:putative phosphoribosyl transferase
MVELALPFRDRQHAGCVLAGKLAHYGGRPDVLVLALPRGGVAVGFEVARALQAPLDVLMVRKLGFPGQEEYAMGAIACCASGAGGAVCVMNPLPHYRVSHALVDKVITREQAELERREQFYRGQRLAISLAGRCVIVVDDGLATGATMRAALRAVRQQQPARLVAAVPVGAEGSCRALQGEADEVVCAATPQPFRGVGLWYEEFEQASDEEVCSLLHQAWRAQAHSLQ